MRSTPRHHRSIENEGRPMFKSAFSPPSWRLRSSVHVLSRDFTTLRLSTLFTISFLSFLSFAPTSIPIRLGTTRPFRVPRHESTRLQYTKVHSKNGLVHEIHEFFPARQPRLGSTRFQIPQNARKHSLQHTCLPAKHG